MNVCVVGTGYVGLVSGACLSEMGNTVTCVDIDADRIAGLKQGKLPIYEPGLEALVINNYRQGRLRFSTSLRQTVPGTDICMIAVGTPSGEDGAANLDQVFGVARELGAILEKHCIVVTKSTVPVGTTHRVGAIIREELARRGASVEFDAVSNPEFLKEGDAIKDFMSPDRIIVGTDSPRAIQSMRKLYAPFIRNHDRMLAMGVKDAEMTKYAANAMLATKISFMNEIASVCEQVDVDVENVRLGIGSDQRIGYSFIYPGCGYGGSCFPKDVRALIHTAGSAGIEPAILRAVETRNELQKQRLNEKVTARFGANLQGLTMGLWGLAFKPGTDDMREAPALSLLQKLIDAGARVIAYDPAAMDMARQVLPAQWFERGLLTLAKDQYAAVENVNALILVTEWKPFRNPDFQTMKRLMKQAVIFDGRNQYDPAELLGRGFEYYGIGRTARPASTVTAAT